MQLDFGTCSGSMIISMIKYLQKILDEWPEVLGGTNTCPATDNMLKVREDKDRLLLCEEMARQFHRTAAQFVFFVRERDRTLRRWYHS